MLGFAKAQGATEYLVLLAVVLIIALVSIALLGFFPGTASDTSLAESQIYWKSASPIAIIETGEAYGAADRIGLPDSNYNNLSSSYLRLRNTGSYPITITKVLGGGASVSIEASDVNLPTNNWHNISITISPGEESCFGSGLGTVASGGGWDKLPCRQHEISFDPIGGFTQGGFGILAGASTVCDENGKGILTVNSFGFEYTESIQGVTITKKQIGTKPLIAKCTGLCDLNTGTCAFN